MFEWWICGEWCQGPYKTKEQARAVLWPLVKHEVFSNQVWWLSRRKKGWKGW